MIATPRRRHRRSPDEARRAAAIGPAARLLRAAIVGYQWTLRPLLGSQCRFEPSCSCYALDALAAHGAWPGAWLAARRVLRCNPWNAGGYDPMPPKADRIHA